MRGSSPLVPTLQHKTHLHLAQPWPRTGGRSTSFSWPASSTPVDPSAQNGGARTCHHLVPSRQRTNDKNEIILYYQKLMLARALRLVPLVRPLAPLLGPRAGVCTIMARDSPLLPWLRPPAVVGGGRAQPPSRPWTRGLKTAKGIKRLREQHRPKTRKYKLKTKRAVVSAPPPMPSTPGALTPLLFGRPSGSCGSAAAGSNTGGRDGAQPPRSVRGGGADAPIRSRHNASSKSKKWTRQSRRPAYATGNLLKLLNKMLINR